MKGRGEVVAGNKERACSTRVVGVAICALPHQCSLDCCRLRAAFCLLSHSLLPISLKKRHGDTVLQVSHEQHHEVRVRKQRLIHHDAIVLMVGWLDQLISTFMIPVIGSIYI